MPAHKHTWVWLLPKPSELQISDEERIDYWLAYRLLSDIHVCTGCNKTGHTIKSARGGVRVHIDAKYTLQKAFDLSQKYGFALPISIGDKSNL